MQALLARFGVALVFLTTLIVFWTTAAPGLAYHDSGEFALAAALGGIPHPPGSPTWCLLAWPSVVLGRLLFPEVEAVRLTNLFSGFWGAATIALTVSLAQQLSRKYFRSPSGPVLCLLVVPAVLLNSSAFVEQASVTEQYTLLTALLMVSLLALVQRRAFLLGLSVSLALGNHPSQVVLMPLLAAAVVRAPRVQRGRVALLCLIGFLLGLTVFLYLPLRSQSNPTLDTGNIKTLERLLWALRREQWQTRALTQAPPGFIAEWLLSYDFLTQTGIVGVALALFGGLRLWLCSRRWLLLLMGISLLYTGGLLLGHLRQAGIDLSYLRDYGVTDWHLPLYVFTALFAALGAVALAERAATRHGIVTLGSSVLLIFSGAHALGPNSLRHFNAPQRLLRELLEPLPEQAVLIPSDDNLSFALGYLAYGSRAGLVGRTVWHRTDILTLLDQSLLGEPRWSAAAQTRLFERLRHETPTFHAPLPPAQAPLVVPYAAGHPTTAAYLLPCGGLFTLHVQPVTDQEVRVAEQENIKRNPTLFAPATGNENHLEREARGLLHQSRAAYFYERHLWKEASDAFALSCTYLNRSGSVWFCLATAYENQGEIQKAQEAYLRAIEAAPSLEGPRTGLGILLAQNRHFSEARRLFAEEVTLHPGSRAAQANLELVTRQLAAR